MSILRILSLVGLAAVVVPLSAAAAVDAPPAAITPPPTPANKPETMSAIGRWVVSGEDGRCMATRQYGATTAPITLGIRSRPLRSDVRLTIVEPLRVARSMYEDGGVQFGVGTVPIGTGISISRMADDRRMSDLRIERAQLEKSIPSKELWFYSKSTNRRLRVEGLGGVLKVLATCERQLVADNGMSFAEQARMASPPDMVGTVADYVFTNDYPTQALSNYDQGTAMVRVDVGADATATDCRTVESSGSKLLDAKTCAVSKRMRFIPAKDRDGKPMRALFFYTIGWSLP